jgi:O-antigen ligase
VTPALPDDADRRLLVHLETVAGVWLVLLPLLRPLVWSGEPTDPGNLFMLVLLAAATATGLLLRALAMPAAGAEAPWWRRPAPWGAVFLVAAAVGSWASPLPATAWALTCAWALHLAAPLALLPIIRRRPGLLVGGLLAGLVGELLLMAGQVAFERPHLASMLLSDPGLSVQQRVADQLQVRIASWRLEGSFLLANTLASYLVLVLPLAVSTAWELRHRSGLARWWCAGLVVATALALVMTGSKAGILALLVATAVTAAAGLRSWRLRGAIAAALVVVLAIALLVPALRERVAASAGVRLDYWRAGVELVAERPFTGHGLGGFEVHYPRVKSPAAEETILAHQETLQAAVDLGLPAAAVLLGWWILLMASLWPGPRAAMMPPVTAPGGRSDRVAVVGAGALLLFALLQVGVMGANTATYPGALPTAWSLALGAIALLVATAARHLPLPSPLACWCALLACLVHAQADFSLHSPQVVGIAALVSCLGIARLRPLPDVPAIGIPGARQRLFAVGALVVLLLVTAGVLVSAGRTDVLERGRQVEGALARLRLAQAGRLDAGQREQVMEALDYALGRVVAEEGRLEGDPIEALSLSTIRQTIEESRRFPADPALALVALGTAEHFQALLPARAAQVTPHLERLAADWPGHVAATRALAEHYLRLARAAAPEARRVPARQAQAWAHRAVELYPTHLPMRALLISAAELTGDRETVLQQNAEIEGLAPLVHPDNRLPAPPRE